MAMNLLKRLIVLMIITTVMILVVNGDCCKKNRVYVAHECGKNVPNEYTWGKYCRTKVCYDGTTTSSLGFCGFGSCNIIGCNCDGGCRWNTNNTQEMAVALFRQKYHLEYTRMDNEEGHSISNY